MGRRKGKRSIGKIILVFFLPVSWPVVLHTDTNSGLPCAEPLLEPGGVAPGYWWQAPHHVEL